MVTGSLLLFHGILQLNHTNAAGPLIPQIFGALLGLLILVGLWTPLAGVLVVVVEIWIVFEGAGNELSFLLAVLGGTLAMIGPGAWSIDARLFGRKHIVG